MSFSQSLENCARLVDMRLNEVFGGNEDAGFVPAGVPERLREAMRHAVLAGGKRFRPFLVLECAGLFGLSPVAALPAAMAIELVHCYSLAHDDLPAMDNDELRRGRPTVWKAYDEWTAILAGDALLTLAFDVLASPAAHQEAGVRIELAGLLAKAAGAGGMAGGQALDLAAEKYGDPPVPTADHVRRIQAMKTAALIAAACEMGAVLGQATGEERAALGAYGRSLGLAFQIADDLLDVEGDVAVVGKAVAKDSSAGKATLVGLLGVEAARAELKATEQAALASLEIFGDRAAVLREAAAFVVNRQH